MSKEQEQNLKPPFSWHEVIRSTKEANLNLTGLNVFISNWENLDSVIEGLKIKFISISDGNYKGLSNGIYIQTNVMSNSLDNKTESHIMCHLNSYFILNILSEVNTTKVKLDLPDNFKEVNKIDKKGYLDASKAIQINSSFSTSQGCKVYEILPFALNATVQGMNEFFNGERKGGLEIFK